LGPLQAPTFQGSKAVIQIPALLEKEEDNKYQKTLTRTFLLKDGRRFYHVIRYGRPRGVPIFSWLTLEKPDI
jgi:hypothetical protein